MNECSELSQADAIRSLLQSQKQVVKPQPSYPAPESQVPRLSPSPAELAEASALSREPVDPAAVAPSSPPKQGNQPPTAAVTAMIVAFTVAAALLLFCVAFAIRRQRRRRRSVGQAASGSVSGHTYGTRDVMDKRGLTSPGAQPGAETLSMRVTPPLTAQEHSALEAATEVSDLQFTQRSNAFGNTSYKAYLLDTNTYWATTVDFDRPLSSFATPALSKVDFLHAQLSSLGRDAVVLERYVLLGPNQRRQGGQGVVAFAKGVHDDLGYALKFFADRSSFLAERDMYRSNTLGRLLPQVHAEYDPEDTPSSAVLRDRAGRPLPPCIVMERGEGLPDWSKRAKPDVFQSVAVLAHVATRLRDMHESGYAHRDIKPENLMFLPRENRWTVIDFGCAAAVGEVAPLAYTLVYAAPEIAVEVARGAKTIVVDPAVDAWALGVVAFELLTGQSAFNLVTEGRDSVLGKLQGQGELAWEGELAEKNPAARRRLGLFRGPVLSLLHRDPAQRATLATFCRTVNTVFSSPTTVEHA